MHIHRHLALCDCRDTIALSRLDQRLMFLPDGALRIESTVMSDAGMYECHAVSDAGNATKLMHLIVQGTYVNAIM